MKQITAQEGVWRDELKQVAETGKPFEVHDLERFVDELAAKKMAASYGYEGTKSGVNSVIFRKPN